MRGVLEGWVLMESSLFGAIVMEVAYGVRTPLEGSHFTRIAQEAMEMLSKAFLPGAFLVDAFPACAHFILSVLRYC